MNSREVTKNITIIDDLGKERTFQLEKFTALVGVKLGKFFLSKLLPIAQDLVPTIKGSTDINEMSSQSLIDKIDLEQIADILDKLSDDDLEKIAYVCLSSVSEYLPVGPVAVINKNTKTYQIEDVEYDPVIFVKLIFEQIKFGLSDFFKGNRWTSMFQTDSLADLSGLTALT